MPKAFTTKWTKVVVRRLPPTLTEQAFREALKKAGIGQFNWLAFYQGKVSPKRTVYSRVYLDFSTPQHVLDFKSVFDGHVFVSSRGSQYKCSVEYAPYQKVPRNGKVKKDPREGTIERDSDFKNFVEDLDKPPEMLPSAQKQREQAEALKKEGQEQRDTAPGPIVTPLMEFIINKRLSKSSKRNQKSKITVLQKDDDKRGISGSGDKDGGSKNSESKLKKAERKRAKQEKDRAEKGRKEASDQVLRSSKPPRGSKRSGSASRPSKSDHAENNEHADNNASNARDSGRNHEEPENAKSRKKETDKVRAGHQPWVPRVRITRKGALDKDESGNANGNGAQEDDDYDRNIPVISTPTFENENRGGRQDSRRMGNLTEDGKADHRGVLEGFDESAVGNGDGRGRRYGRRGGRGRRGGGRGKHGTSARTTMWVKKENQGP